MALMDADSVEGFETIVRATLGCSLDTDGT
jgi:hypothetical protein